MKAKTGTREWATHSANVTIGCSNGCRYCYARANYKNYDTSGIPWETERTSLKELYKERTKREGMTMFPTQHDITENNIDDCLVVLKNLLKVGNRVLIVSKPSVVVSSRLINELMKYKDQITFRFTIGSLDDKTLRYWEPNAPSFDDRFSSLKNAFNVGYETSVSCEPMLMTDMNEIQEYVDKLSCMVTDTIWLGKMNKISLRAYDVPDEVIEGYEAFFDNDNIFKLYSIFKDNSKISWKDSFKEYIEEFEKDA